MMRWQGISRVLQLMGTTAPSLLLTKQTNYDYDYDCAYHHTDASAKKNELGEKVEIIEKIEMAVKINNLETELKAIKSVNINKTETTEAELVQKITKSEITSNKTKKMVKPQIHL